MLKLRLKKWADKSKKPILRAEEHMSVKEMDDELLRKTCKN